MAELVQALKSLMVSARAGSGLMYSRLYQQVGDDTSLCYVEKWQTKEDFESQVRSIRYTQLLALMEMAVEHPSLEFHTVSQIQGLDYLEAIRSKMKV